VAGKVCFHQRVVAKRAVFIKVAEAPSAEVESTYSRGGRTRCSMVNLDLSNSKESPAFRRGESQ
jgi:hypothetical protein